MITPKIREEKVKEVMLNLDKVYRESKEEGNMLD